MAHNESPSGGTWLAWQHFIPWWQSFLFKEYTKYVRDFLQESRCPLNLYDLRRAWSSAQQVWKSLQQLLVVWVFFSVLLDTLPLWFLEWLGEFPSLPYISTSHRDITLKPYTSQCLYFTKPPLAMSFPNYYFFSFFFFFSIFCSGFWFHTQKAGAHSAASSGILSSSSHHKAVWILKLWLINNAFQQNINPFPPISYNYSLK